MDHGVPGGTYRTELSSGVRIVTEHLPHAQSVSFGLFAGVGSRDEPANLAGSSHFLEHLLFKGTPQRTARQIANVVDAVGGDINAHTARESTAYYTRLPPEAAAEGLDLLCDVVSHPALRPAEVDAEREVILEELAMADDDPDDVVHRMLWENLFPGHPLGRETLGSAQTIGSITRDEIVAFHADRYRTGTLVVAAAGLVDHDDVVDEVTRTLDVASGLPAFGSARLAPVSVPEPLVVSERPTEQVHLSLGWLALDGRSPRRYAQAVANHILGGGMASRLFQSVREDRGLAYAVGSGVTRYCDAGALVVSVGTAPGRLGELVAVLDHDIESLVATGVTPEEHAGAIGYLVGATRLGLEDTGSRMLRLAGEEMLWGRVVAIDEHLEALRAVTIDDVNTVLSDVLDAPRTVAAVGPVSPDDPVLVDAAQWRR